MTVQSHKTESIFGKKLRRFFRRLMNEIRRMADDACSHIVGSPSAAEMPYIGLEESVGE